jgi:RNA polymerase sigma-70 factor (ECF subfamily)
LRAVSNEAAAPEPSDEALVAALARGDRSALAALYDRYAGVLMGVGLRRLGDRVDAEEVLHDVFVEAWRTAGTYDPARGTVRAWLVTRMHSRALDRLRSPSLARRDGLDAAPEARAPDADPAGELERRRVSAALAALPAEQREVIELAYFAGLSASEIASRTSLPVGTVKSRTAAALDKLRRAFGRGGPERE